MTSRRTRARPGEGALLREEILRTAEELLVESGSEDALTLRAVARRAGVTTPSVYLHFADKEALVEAVCLRAWDDLGNRMRAAADRVDDPFAAMGRCGRAYVRFALDHPVQYRLLMMRPAGREGLPPASAACFRYVVDAVAACVDAGVLVGDPARLAVGLWSAAHGCASLLITNPGFPWPADLDALIDDTVRMAGFGAALSSRLPPTWVPSSADLAVHLDTATGRLAGSS